MFFKQENFSVYQSESGVTAVSPFCASDLAHQQALDTDPSFLQKQQAFEKSLLEHLRSGGNHAPVQYTLPVVVHIIHNNGPENITDAQVIQGIQDLNGAFANMGYYDQGTGVDTEIQFCLAKRDPDGNATTGITRDQSPLTSMNMTADDLALKNINRWEPLDYINIWLVGEIQGGVAGYAYFPASHGGPQDGIVMEAGYFGSTQANSGVQVHEMGHYLGLYHTFQGGCTNNDCLVDGDRVCDTPPDQSTAWVPCNSTPNTCSTDANSGFTSDQPDMFWNYMDYSDFNCYSAFSQGQADRMIFSIENPRVSLIDSEGCNDPCLSNITASFTASAMTIDAGQTVNFANGSTNATTYDWQVDGTSFSSATNASYTFNAPGNFEVILYATNADPNCLGTDTVSINVNCPTVASFSSVNLFPAVGEMLNFTNTSTGATSYDWLVNGVSQSTATDFSYTFSISGTYSVCLDAAGQFCDDSECVTLFVFDDSVSCEGTFLKTFGLPNSEEDGWAICESDNGGFFMAGGSGNQTLLVKIDPTGTVAWAREFDLCPQNDVIRDIRLDSDGMLVGCGYGLNASTAGNNFFFRYDHLADNFLWVKNTANIDLSRQINFLEKSPGGNYLAFGQFDGCTNASIIELDRATGNFQWMKHYALGNCQTFSKSIIANGSIFTTGRYNFAGGGTNKMRGGITRLDLDGSQVWSRLYLVPVNPNNARIYPNGLIEDNGSLIGMSGGDNDGSSATVLNFHLYSTDLDGNIQWAKNMNIIGGDKENARHLVNLPDGYLLMGAFDSNTLGRQIFLVKTDKQGELVWSRQYGGPNDEEAFGLLVNNGFIHFLGRSGTGTAGEFFMAKLTLDGLTLDACDQISDLQVTSDDFPNPYDGLHPFTVNDENHLLNNFPTGATDVTVEENPICESPCVEVCDNGVDDDNDGYVDCYDTDCPCNTDDCLVNDIAQNFATQLAWQSTEDEVSVDGTPIIANLDPQVDSIPEIVVVVSTASASQNLSPHLLIFKGDGSNAGNPAELPIQSGYDIYSAVNPAVGDVNRDGVPEVVMVSGDRRVRVYSNFDANANPPMQEIAVSTDLADHRNRKPYLADFNADGISEVYVGDDIFQFDFSTATPTLTKELSGGSSFGAMFYGVYQEPNCSPVAVDILNPQHCNGDPDCEGIELVAGNVIYSVDLLTNDGDGFEIKVQRDLNDLQNQHNYLDGYTSVADVNLDGILDVVVSGGRNNANGVYAWDRNGVLGWWPHLPPLANPNRSGALPCIANVFDDTQAGAAVDFPEIIVTSQGYLNCYSINADALGQPDGAWWILNTTDLSGATGATVFDFNADGIEEIVYRDEDNLRIMYGGNAPFPPGVDAERNWETFVCGSGTFDEHPVIADVDNDRQANIIVTGYTFAGTNNPPADYRGRLRVFEPDLTNGDPWMSARPIWNQFNYFVVNVNDDLSLPLEQQLHQLEFPDVGSGYRPFNKFVSQIPLLDNDYQPYLPVPDATVGVGTAECTPNGISISLTVCNEGRAPLPAETPIAFYLGDPTTTAATLHFTTLLGADVLPDSCFSLTANLPSANGTIHVVVNDDGSLTTPYNFGNDFPVTNIPECDYLNNPASFNFNYTPPAPPDLGPDLSFCNNGTANLDAGPGWASYQWQDGFPEQVYTAWDEGTYWVTVTDSCGNEFSDTIAIEMDTSMQFDLGPDTMLCSGEPLAFDVPGFVVYEWLPDVDLSCNDCPDPTATPSQSTTYTLVATDVNGCLSVDSIVVEVGGEVEIFDTLSICSGDSVLIFGNFETQPGDYLDTLLNPNGCDTIITFTLEILPLIEAADTFEICAGDSILIFGNYENMAGEYADTIPAPGGGCDTLLTVTLEILPLIESMETVEICEGDSVLIFGNYENMAGQYTDTIPAVGCDTLLTITLEVLPPVEIMDTILLCYGDSALVFGQYVYEAGEFSGTLSNPQGCDTSLTVSVINFGLGFKLHFPVDACEGQANGAVLTFGLSGSAVQPLSFIWSNGSEEPLPDSLAAGEYSVTATDATGCQDTASITIGSIPVEAIAVAFQDASCFGIADGSLTVTEYEPGSLFSLDGEFYSPSPDFINLPAGEHIVFVQTPNGCLIEQAITIQQPPELVVNLPADVTIELGDSVILASQTSPLDSLTYFWSPVDWLSCTDCPRPWASPLETTLYTLTVTTPTGCSGQDDMQVTVIRKVNVYAPNAFSPNGDGVNDNFTIFAGSGVVRVNRLLIFDRWGELVFEGTDFPPNDPSQGWDGVFRGEEMDPAVFAWFAEIKFVDGTVEKLEGGVTLVR